MNVQLITKNANLKSGKDITVSDLSHPRAMDDFDVNVIDLSDEKLWRYNGREQGCLNSRMDLLSVAEMVRGTQRAKIMYVFPQDGDYLYHLYDKQYLDKERIKNIICSSSYRQGYLECIPYDGICVDIVFEPTVTMVEGQEYNADFHFGNLNNCVLTKSERSKKNTTVMVLDRIYFTTLKLCDSTEDIIRVVSAILKEDEAIGVPEWVTEYRFRDDDEQKNIIELCNKKIDELKKEIEVAEDKVKENNMFKSILYTNGDALVEVVYTILEEMLKCDLSGFIDEKKEDFLIEMENCVLIGEIKGVSSNVRNEHVSQLDVHYQSYIDDHKENGIDANTVHGLLIINPFRTKRLEEREPIHDEQILLAKRNKSLIIETITLLKGFELFCADRVSSEQIIKVLTNKTGLLSIEDLESGFESM